MSEREPSDSSCTLVTMCESDLIRLGLQTVLTTHPYVRLVGEAINVPDAEEIVAREKPWALIVVLGSQLDMADLVRRVRMSAPTIRIIAISDMEDRHSSGGRLFSGIDGIVLNIQPVEVLLATVDYLRRQQGISWWETRGAPTRSDGWEPTERQDAASRSLRDPRDGSLTDREQAIAVLVGEGLSNKDIAHRLHVSSITVRHHLTNLFDKLGISSRLQLLRWVQQKGLAGCGPAV